jgi:3D (Asp-Asp-Asp) domain-containing protein
MSNSLARSSRFLRPAHLLGAAALLLGSLGAAQVSGTAPNSTVLDVTSLESAPVELAPVELAQSRATGVSRVVKATAYSSEVAQTDSTPFVTATGTRVRPGVIALSRDLLRTFPYGSRVTLQDSAGVLNGRVFIVEDTMNARLRNTIDIWMGSRSQALQWGSRTVRITAVR